MNKTKKILFFMISCLLFSMIIFQETNLSAKEKWIVKNIKKVDEAIVKMIDAHLRKQQALKLNIKGNKKAAEKKMQTLRKKIKKVNEQGIIFQYEMDKSKKGSTTYLISKENAKLYDYSVQFVKKLHKTVKKAIFDNIFYSYGEEEKQWITAQYFGGKEDDYQNVKEVYQKLRLWDIYNTMVSELRDYYSDKEGGRWDESTRSYIETKLIYKGISEIPISKKYFFNVEQDESIKTLLVSEEDIITNPSGNTESPKVQAYGEWGVEDYETNNVYDDYDDDDYDSDGDDSYNFDMDYEEEKKIYVEKVITLKTFEEFKATIEDVDEYLKNHHFWNSKERDFEIITKKFSELSDALKLYLIDKSGYFNCNFGRPDFGMTYTYKYSNYTGSKGMRTLLENKATGVCQCFASYERQLFNQLDIESYLEARGEISHAFTVVKVKNSKGKILWVPFDYGIGPREGLLVNEKTRNKYLKTEEMRYKLYLRGIKGAPNYKNFTDEDFN